MAVMIENYGLKILEGILSEKIKQSLAQINSARYLWASLLRKLSLLIDLPWEY